MEHTCSLPFQDINYLFAIISVYQWLPFVSAIIRNWISYNLILFNLSNILPQKSWSLDIVRGRSCFRKYVYVNKDFLLSEQAAHPKECLLLVSYSAYSTNTCDPGLTSHPTINSVNGRAEDQTYDPCITIPAHYHWLIVHPSLFLVSWEIWFFSMCIDLLLIKQRSVKSFTALVIIHWYRK